jgi:hypothetical protein
MIKCIPTIDYEIYGNGEGSLKDLVYAPADRLSTIFRKRNARFVVFVEVAELEMMETKGTDPAIDLVKHQIRDFYRDGFELGFHLHPQWYSAHHEGGGWILDYSEYNLCTLPRERIAQIIDRSLAYLRNILGVSDFTPISFRAGGWLFQPTETLASVLAGRGIKLDSSVFKGGLQQQHKLDYRPALKNGYYWKFKDDVNLPEPLGALLELPIHTQMVPTWKMFTTKRIGLQQKAPSASHNNKNGFYRIMDFLRFRYPLKLDFCRMTLKELTHMVDTVIREDQDDPTSFRPIVAIGHTKDLVDYDTVESFLAYLNQKRIKISTFEEVYPKCQ